MNGMKTLVALVLALALTLTLVGSAMASSTPANGSIEITPPTGITGNNTYYIYKVFDATGDTQGHISYKKIANKTETLPYFFSEDTAGNITYTGNNTELDATEIAAIKTYIGSDQPVATATSVGEAKATATGLGFGYYYITTTTGSLVTIDSTNPYAQVNDKNSIPQLDKTITGASDITDSGKKALAQLGTDVEYTVPITVGKGSINLAFHDTMETGLTFKGNNYVTVTASPAISTANWYTIKATPDQGEDLTITFIDGIAEDTVITVKYLATINAEALTALENDAYLTYGENHSTTHKTTETYNGEISVIKYNGAKANAQYLGGAGFKLKNADGKWYKLTGTVVSWEDAQADGDEHISAAADGKVPAFIGLANGTYTLVETTVPEGYNKAADVSLTIASGDYSLDNLQQVAEVENNQGQELPSTGGIGTTIFYIAGAVLVLGAAAVILARRKAEQE